MNILIVTQVKQTGLTYHRQTVPHFNLLKNNPEYKIDYTYDISGATKLELSKYNIISFLRIIDYNENTNKIIKKCKDAGCKVVIDIDDFWHLNRGHHLWNKYKKNNIQKQTVDGIKGADWVTTTTDYFAEKIMDFNKNVTVLPNSIDPNEKQFEVNNTESDRVRFGWVGGVYHYSDINMIKEDIKYIWDSVDNNRFQFCLGGFNNNREYINIENVFTNNYKNLDDEYASYLKAISPVYNYEKANDKPYKRMWGKDVFNYAKMYNEIDVALIPLIDNPFNNCKSQLKIIEAGWFEKPIIVSNVYPYKIDCNSSNSFLVDNDSKLEFGRTIEYILDNPNDAKDRALKLNELIKEKYTIEVVNKDRNDLYKRLCE